MNHHRFTFWSMNAAELYQKLHTSPQGLSEQEAQQRLKKFGFNQLSIKRHYTTLTLFLSQFTSPLVLLLLFAAILSFILQNSTDALIIMIIVVVSGTLSFFQERGARLSVEKLIALVKVQARVLRNGQSKEIDVEKVVPGDIVLLSAGDIVPGDCLILEARDCFVDEATLTGETFHVEKKEGVAAADAPLRLRPNALFMGSHVVSGTVKALVVLTGKATEFGKISERLKFQPPATAFEQGVRNFGYFLMEITLILVIAIFAFNIYLSRPVVESFLFAISLAVGLTPQLLPAIISINLSHGAKRMAKDKVIVKRLSSIENLGSMNVLCADKTGTLTQGVIELNGVVDAKGQLSARAHLLAYLNAAFQTGYDNPIDKAILQHKQLDIANYVKCDEIPYDFIRKKMTLLVKSQTGLLLISKGAFAHILKICDQVQLENGGIVSLSSMINSLEEQFEEYSRQGYRALGIAYKVHDKDRITRDDEKGLIFAGFLLFFDPPKVGVKMVLSKLKEAKIEMKILTGDHAYVAAHIAEQIELLPPRDKNQSFEAYLKQHFLRGEQIDQISDHALMRQVQEKTIFAELEPRQKERIILALRKSGQIVGFLGDGVNDVTALHTADVGMSVNISADVVKEVADIVLLKKDLGVLLSGIQEGRKTFANTMKYIFMATSANFGNMFSMASVSLFIPFLPLLPKQILLMNLLTDVPEMTIATDYVDPERVAQPVKWDIGFIRRFMVIFGLISSLFDFLTFGVLFFVLKASEDLFRTGWFLESVASAAIIVLVIRTKDVFFKSRPSPYLTMAVGGIVLCTMLIPFTPLAELFGFVPLPHYFYWMIAAIVGLYVLTVEIAKKCFYSLPKWQEQYRLKHTPFTSHRD